MFCNMRYTLPPECVCNYNQTILLGVNMNLVYEYLCVQENIGDIILRQLAQKL